MVHTIIGLYKNGTFKTNGVESEYIAEHIAYNITMRPERALILDGKIIYLGHLSPSSRDNIEDQFKDIIEFIDTKPYQ